MKTLKKIFFGGIIVICSPFLIMAVFDFISTKDSVDIFLFLIFLIPVIISCLFLRKTKKGVNKKPTANKTPNRLENNDNAREERKDYAEEIPNPKYEKPIQMSGEYVTKKTISHMDNYFWDAGRFVIDNNKASIGMLQRHFKIGFNQAAMIMDKLCEAGVVGEETGTIPRKILMGREEFDVLQINGRMEVNEKPQIQSVIMENQSYQPDRISLYNNKIDYMTGEDFELYIAQMLGKIGFYNIQTTKGSGDQGVDILAEKESMKYAFQCKRYDKTVGNKAVQEVFAGKFFYHCHVAVVVTNNYFTQSAKDLAHENGVVLWDRDFLEKRIREIGITRKVIIEENVGSFNLLNIDKDIVAIQNKKISELLYNFLDSFTKELINAYLLEGNKNSYEKEMSKYIEYPIILYNMKLFRIGSYSIYLLYYCNMNENFRKTETYNKLTELSKEKGEEYKDNLFRFNIFYDINDIVLLGKELIIKKKPKVNIDTTNMEKMERFENPQNYKKQSDCIRLIKKNFFLIKAGNIKFE